MKDGLVSVRMPASLIKQLQIITTNDHYLDLSECIRSIIRQKAMSYADQYLDELSKVKAELKTKLAAKADVQQVLKKHKVAEDLRRVLREVEGIQ